MLQKTKNPTKLLLIFATGKLSHMYMQEVVYLFYNRWNLFISYLDIYNFFKLCLPCRFFTIYSTMILSSTLVKKKFIRKWIYKKNRINKSKLLRRIRKLLIHKKFKKTNTFFYFNYQSFLKKIKFKNQNPLSNRIPLTQRVIENSYLEFFYKFNKEGYDIVSNYNEFLTLKSYNIYGDKDFTIFLRNYHQKPYWKLRTARILHWNFFFKTKTIREQRYKKFLPLFLQKQKNFTNIYIYFLILFTNMQFSWIRIQQLTSFLKNILVVKVSDSVFFLPTTLSNLFNWKFLKKKNFFKKKKISRWSYLNYKRWQFPWLQRKKNFPKNIKHVQPTCNVFKSLTQFDTLTGYLLYFGNLGTYELSPNELFKVNFLTKLHMYRYNSN